MRLRKHRHRFIAEAPMGLVQIIYCRTKGCGFCYEQYLLFDVARYAA